MKEDSVSGRWNHMGKGPEGEKHGRVDEERGFNMARALTHGMV